MILGGGYELLTDMTVFVHDDLSGSQFVREIMLLGMQQIKDGDTTGEVVTRFRNSGAQFGLLAALYPLTVGSVIDAGVMGKIVLVKYHDRQFLNTNIAIEEAHLPAVWISECNCGVLGQSFLGLLRQQTS